jgi:hypothetical protein
MRARGNGRFERWPDHSFMPTSAEGVAEENRPRSREAESQGRIGNRSALEPAPKFGLCGFHRTQRQEVLEIRV